MNSKSRWLASIIAVAIIASTGLFLTNALAKQRRVSAAGKAPVRAAILPPASPIYVPGTFTFSTPQAHTHVPIPAVSPCPLPTGCPSIKDQGIEPEIKVDLFGTVYVTAIHGYPGGVDLWKSTDKGATFS